MKSKQVEIKEGQFYKCKAYADTYLYIDKKNLKHEKIKTWRIVWLKQDKIEEYNSMVDDELIGYLKNDELNFDLIEDNDPYIAKILLSNIL